MVVKSSALNQGSPISVSWLKRLFKRNKELYEIKRQITCLKTSKELKRFFDELEEDGIDSEIRKTFKRHAKRLANELYLKVIHGTDTSKRQLKKAVKELEEAKNLARFAMSCRASWEAKLLYKEILAKQEEFETLFDH